MNPPSKPALLSIIAHARSGALDHAWALFTSHGFDRVDDDAAVLSVRGRLLKDRARAASGDERRALYLEAARAYGVAGALGEGATYPLINAATLSLLAGQAETSRELAALALALIDSGRDGPETPYYREATRAEALLLLGRMDEARASLAAAVASAPLAWEDHASTLRQFALVLDARGEDKAWLDPCRPPRCLHFAGHMAVADEEAGALTDRVRAVIGQERIGFAWGALAAGADILIAETLLACGVELHVVLPGEPAEFRRGSVEPSGGDWAERFDVVLGAADTVRVVAAAAAPTPGIQIAAEVAMGCAVMHAGALATEAVQLLVLEDEAAVGGAAGGSVWAGEAWRAAGRRQIVAAVDRGGPAPRPEVAAQGDHRATAAAMLAIRLGRERDPARTLP
ncbi:MAG TPA: tetratricopeptide repeat-containing protein, partial [Caulobacteraceae bacterium]|nr:tetratricopeptide repeat-containing protein [Caulobacteraceae bacterium]